MDARMHRRRFVILLLVVAAAALALFAVPEIAGLVRIIQELGGPDG